MEYIMNGDPETRKYLWYELYNIVYRDVLNKKNEIKMSADVDFNFSPNNRNVVVLKEKYGNDKEIINLIQECSNKYHTVYNFSIIPGTGALNDKKGTCDNDRFDRYIYLLKVLLDSIQNDGADAFYNSFREIVIEYVRENKKFVSMDEKFFLINAFPGRNLKGKSKLENYIYKLENNKKPLIYFLESYSFEEYCKQFYKIENQDILKELLRLGEKRRLESLKDYKDYINIAKLYWENKEKVYKSEGITKDITDRLNDKVADEYIERN